MRKSPHNLYFTGYLRRCAPVKQGDPTCVAPAVPVPGCGYRQKCPRPPWTPNLQQPPHSPPSQAVTLAGGRGPSNPRRLQVDTPQLLILALQPGKIPIATLPMLGVQHHQQPSEQLSKHNKVSHLQQPHTASPLPTLLLNFPLPPAALA